MLTRSWTGTVGEAEKLRLADRIDHGHQDALDDLVLQRCNAQRMLFAIRFRYIPSATGQRTIDLPVNSPVQVFKVSFRVLVAIELQNTCHLIHRVLFMAGQMTCAVFESFFLSSRA
ncbi:hypothetical protein WL08_13770 [Burkholderia ubonensis]|nr:hypothetical protein WL08_13770 [Burkholderia ubonensis]